MKAFTLTLALVVILASFSYVSYDFYTYHLSLQQMQEIEKKDTLEFHDAVQSIVLTTSKDVMPKKFAELTDQINIQAINTTADKLGYDDNQKKRALVKYAKYSNDINKSIYEKMRQESNSDNTNKHLQQKYINKNAVEAYNRELSHMLCSTVSLSLDFSHNNIAGEVASIFKDPCTTLLKEFFTPISEMLIEQAIVEDINQITLDMKKQVQKSLLEVATVEYDYNYDVTVKRQRNYWDTFTGTTRLNAEVQAKIKVGFDLNESFLMQVNHTDKILFINLPKPKMLSNEIDYHFGEIKKTFLIGPSEDGIYNELQEKSKKQLQNLDLKKAYVKAQRNATNSLNSLFDPVINVSQLHHYDIQVSFNDNPKIIKQKQIKPEQLLKKSEPSKSKQLDMWESFQLYLKSQIA